MPQDAAGSAPASGRLGGVNNETEYKALEKRIVSLTDQLTRTFVDALQGGEPGDE